MEQNQRRDTITVLSVIDNLMKGAAGQALQNANLMLGLDETLVDAVGRQQPVHLHVADTLRCATQCATQFGNPCTRFCPANVYEMVDDAAGGKRLQVNAANCVHCKACDIKDPYGIITWTTPEGGGGPKYKRL